MLRNKNSVFIFTETVPQKRLKHVTMSSCMRNKRFQFFHIGFKLIMIVICTYLSINFLMDFYLYPSVLTMRVKRNGVQNFPAVTICNLNKIPKSVLCDDSVRPFLEEINALSFCPIVDDRVSFHSINVFPNQEKPPPVLSAGANLAVCPEIVNAELLEERLKFAKISDFFFQHARENHSFGQQPSELIVQCTYNGRKCSERNFTKSLSAVYGNCFTFNSRLYDNSNYINDVTSGATSGLFVEFYVNLMEYTLTKDAGLRVVIHSPKEHPMPEYDGFYASPGFDTSVSVRQTNIHRLPYPYGDGCSFYGEPPLENVYNSKDCYKMCMQNITEKHCGCVDPTWLISTGTRVSQCRLSNATDACCMHAVRTMLFNGTERCNCSVPCNEAQYSTSLSFSVLLAEGNFQDTQKGRLHVYLESLSTIVYKSKKKYQFQDLFSNLGGNLGLWLGFSLMTAISYLVLSFEKYLESRNNAINPKNGKPHHVKELY